MQLLLGGNVVSPLPEILFFIQVSGRPSLPALQFLHLALQAVHFSLQPRTRAIGFTQPTQQDIESQQGQ